jgi:hypothetical protein
MVCPIIRAESYVGDTGKSMKAMGLDGVGVGSKRQLVKNPHYASQNARNRDSECNGLVSTVIFRV